MYKRQVFNVILFFILNFINAHTQKKKGFLEGIALGFLFLIIMIIIKLVLFNNSFKVSTFLYYLILFVTSVLGGMFGVNKKSDE